MRWFVSTKQSALKTIAESRANPHKMTMQDGR